MHKIMNVLELRHLKSSQTKTIPRVRALAAKRFKPYSAALTSFRLTTTKRTLNDLIDRIGLLDKFSDGIKRRSLTDMLLFISIGVSVLYNTMHGITNYLKDIELII